MKAKTKARIWRGFTAISASLLSIAVGGVAIVNANAAFINTRLGTTNIKLVETGDGKQDTDYFKSEFSSIAELVDAKEALAEEMSEEGSVLLKNENSAMPMSARLISWHRKPRRTVRLASALPQISPITSVIRKVRG